MEKFNVVWSEGVHGLDKRSRYGIATLLNEMFDFSTQFEFIHHSTMAELPTDIKEAVVVIHGEHQNPTWSKVSSELLSLDKAIVIDIGDEASQFPLYKLQHQNRKVWVQMPIPGKHDFADRYLICGYPHDTKMHLANYDVMAVNRTYDWSFSGQIQNNRRRACLEVVQRLSGVGFWNQTPGFWQGMERGDYYKMLSESKLVFCPSGTCTPDTIRVAEALEAGCLPIVDNVYPGFPAISGYWKYALKEEPPFPLVRDWNHLPTIVAEELQKWPANRDKALAWWKNYKASMVSWIEQDIQNLRKS